MCDRLHELNVFSVDTPAIMIFTAFSNMGSTHTHKMAQQQHCSLTSDHSLFGLGVKQQVEGRERGIAS